MSVASTLNPPIQGLAPNIITLYPSKTGGLLKMSSLELGLLLYGEIWLEIISDDFWCNIHEFM